MSEKPYKISGWYDVYKSIRKPMPRPGYVEEDKRPSAPPIEEEDASIEDLKIEANIVCEGKGHELGEWADAKRGRQNVSTSTCKKCNKSITVIENPLGNETDMMGEALTQNCL